MKKSFSLLISAMAILVIFLAACNKPDEPGDNSNGFDKTGMLTRYIDGLILPQYSSMQVKLAALQTASDAFVQNPNGTTQAAVKVAYDNAHLQYEHIAPFQFGPAENALLDLYVNYSGGLDYNFSTSGTMTGFSVDTIAIESNIASGSYNLASPTRSSFYAQGFPALDYLYFSPNAITRFNNNTANRIKYVQDLVARMETLVDNVTNGWIAYRTEFINNTQTNVGSPIGNIVNQMAYQMDLLKGPRIGWPLGKQSNGIVFADKVEAYYSRKSVAFATELVKGLKNIYANDGSGKGLSDYVAKLGHTQLNTDVLSQFDATITALNAIPDPLSNSLLSQPSGVDAAYKEIQKLLTLIKTDIASVTGVQINYMDNDGD